MRRTTTLAALATLLLPLGLVVTPAQAAGETCDGKAATLVVPEKPGYSDRTDPVTGTPGDDVIVGTDKWDTIDGAGGNDTVCGLAGADTIVGGKGDDRIFGGLDAEPFYPEDDGYAGDEVVPGLGDDFVDLGDDRDTADMFRDFYEEWDAISFAGSEGPVRVDLAAGKATGQGTDTIVVPQFAAMIIGSSHDDVLAGHDGIDSIVGAGGDDRIRARGGDDLVQLDRVSLRFDGQTVAGRDRVSGGQGDDFIHSARGRDRVSGESGRDRLTGGSRGAVLSGGKGRDSLEGSEGVKLYGGSGRDSISTTLAAKSRHTVDGGRDADNVTVRAPKLRRSHWVVSLPRERITADGRKLLELRDTESVSLSARNGRVTFLGDREDNRFSVFDNSRMRAFGRRGNDQLLGSTRNDMLDGGPGRDLLAGQHGRDRLDGGRGRDRCLRGERLRSCERRR